MSDTNPAGSYELTILIMIALRSQTDALQDRLAQQGFGDVRPNHGFAFQLLSFGAASGNEIAEHLGVTKQAASQMLDYLEQHGYVKRERHPGDGRGKLVVLTNRGWECIKATEIILTDLESQWSTIVGADQMQQLRVALRKLVLATNNGVFPTYLRPVW